jgi:hypothetical protein
MIFSEKVDPKIAPRPELPVYGKHHVDNKKFAMAGEGGKADGRQVDQFLSASRQELRTESRRLDH